ncbi:hypothetical protein CANINC_001356 [Pichia inconspicua]|uniref:Uncharacterized protein n=1 Tax=Pichia inconspicua TaxID=52247 RepID=A0A4V4NG03_9ASCO|nr:hypothetical protein CANINC_001356 [[Candida] inconspicua]
MSNPVAHLKMIGEELNKEQDPNKLNILESFGLKFAFAFVLCFCIFVYLDKTSVLNQNTPEENRKIHGYSKLEGEDKDAGVPPTENKSKND